MANGEAPMRVGIDIGGTFTDLVFLCGDGTLHKRKVPSTPADYAEAIIHGVQAFCAEQAMPVGEIAEIVHATTVATNAILERKGARVALLTTEGFRDVLELRRIRIPMSYDLDWQKPVPLVTREFRFGVRERIAADGAILTPLDTAGLEAIFQQIAASAIEAVAVCFLHAYRNPQHEIAIGELLKRRFPALRISLSHEVLPEMLEYERTSTTVVNAYVAPLIATYLDRLREGLSRCGVAAPILVMQSNGGLISAGLAAERPVTIIESGPAAGVVAAAQIAQASGHGNVITLDMGGTTAKASIIEHGEVLRASEYEVGGAVSVSSRLMRGNGYALRIPVIDVSEVGAGGGSIAAVDSGGSLRVGPRSAGSVPGPACYGRGNEWPTVTDANLVLGYLNEDSLAGGALGIRRDLAENAILRHISGTTRLSLHEAAYGIHQVANSNLVRAIKSVSVERGRDPAEFAMMAFGGAGPIHAAAVALELGVRTVLIPPAPGVFSAYGLLRAEVEQHASRTVLTATTDPDLTAITSAFGAMQTELIGRLEREGYSASRVTMRYFADLRYRGQSSEITVLIDATAINGDELRRVEARFENEFERSYGHRGPNKDFELVTCRMIATVLRDSRQDAQWARDGGAASMQRERNVYFGRRHGLLPTPVLARAALDGRKHRGPLIVQEYDTSVVVPPDCVATLDAHTNIVLDISSA